MNSGPLLHIARLTLVAFAAVLGLYRESFAFSSGAPGCNVTAATMSGAEGPAIVPSPGNWSLTAPLTYTSGVALTVAIANTNPGKQFRGILLWATNTAGNPVGAWTIPSGYAAVAGCSGASLTHTSGVAKSLRGFTFTPPVAGTGTITFRAVVTEECGVASCRTSYAFPNGISVVESLYTLSVSRSGDGAGTVIENQSGINCGVVCSADFPANQAVTLLALPAQNSVFAAWTGCDSVAADECTVSMNGQRSVIAAFPEARMDADGSGVPTRYEPATDGVLVLRYLFGLRGPALTNNALAGGATRNAGDIAAYLDARVSGMDVDGDNVVRATSDGLLILRYMLGLRGAALVAGANQSVLNIAQIEGRLATLMPQPAQ